MIRENAILDEKYVEEICKKLDIKCFIKREDVIKNAKQNKISTEEAGRNVRYTFFEEVLNTTNSNKIATAHNSNDNAETVLLNMVRGTGISGLKGIEPTRNNKYIRPLIEINRKEIEEYCIQNNLNPRHDESNDENIYTRNKIRNGLIPHIKKEFNPNVISSINRLSELAYDEDLYFNEIIEKIYNEISTLECTLNLKKFNDLHLVIKRRIILYTINRLIGNTTGIEKIHIEDIIKLCDSNIGNKYLTPRKHIKVLICKGMVKFEKL